MPHNHNFVDKTGRRYGRLVIVRLAGFRNGSSRWLCRCDCGQEKVLPRTQLASGTKSCGCLRREFATRINTTHGQTGTPTHITWKAMISRCEQVSNPSYDYYGDRGIKVCARWRHSFENFLADMGKRPPGLSIDRINNDGNYEPGNCRWATQKQQVNNQRKRARIDRPIRIRSISMAAIESGMSELMRELTANGPL